MAVTIGFLAAAGRSGRAWAGLPAPLRIGGTGMALAAMKQLGEAFTAMPAGTSVTVLPSLGTGGGLAAAAAGAIDLALAARALNDAERAKGLHGFAYAQTPMAFVVHPGVSVRGLGLPEIVSIFSGAMSAWPDGTPIRLIRREPSDADWSMLRTISPGMAEAVRVALERPGLLTVATDQENADALERIAGSFGVMSIGQVVAEARRVAALDLDGVPPTLDALAAGRYPLARTLHIAWREPSRADIANFLAFLRSRPASDAMARLGLIPLAGPGA